MEGRAVSDWLDLFASFLGQAKNEEPIRLKDKKTSRLAQRQKPHIFFVS